MHAVGNFKTFSKIQKAYETKFIKNENLYAINIRQLLIQKADASENSDWEQKGNFSSAYFR